MAASFENADEALEWLYSMQRLGVKLGLENTRRLLASLSLPDEAARFIHVAGTNGKGSTCAFIQALLVEAGEKAVGLFTSPHLVRFNERIRDERGEITHAELAGLVGMLREKTAGWDPMPTFFELALALGLLWFRDRGCAWAVMETGLGGRLDATNVLLPRVCVITRIGMDHMEMLGDTLAAIAGEKAGIIKPGVPVVTGPQQAEAMAVLRQTAEARGSRLIEVTEPWEGSDLGLAGEHQRWNAALAVAAVREAGVVLERDVIEKALAATCWPGRFEMLPGGVVLDGAHNTEAMEMLVKTWKEQFGGRRAAVIFGAVREKAVDEMLARLLEVAGSWHLTAFQSPRALPVAEIRDRILALYPEAAVTCHTGVAEALDAAKSAGHPVLVCGSLFLVGEARALLVSDSGQYQQSWQ